MPCQSFHTCNLGRFMQPFFTLWSISEEYSSSLLQIESAASTARSHLEDLPYRP